MARFKFNLQAVLKQRLAVERQEQLKVAALEQQRLTIENEIRAFQATLQREKSDLREALSRERSAEDEPGVDLRGVRLQANAALHIVAKAQQSVLRLAAVHQRLDAARLDLLAATTSRKGVETLRDRRFEAWQTEEKRKEGNVLDELSVMRAARTSGEGIGSGTDDSTREAA